MVLRIVWPGLGKDIVPSTNKSCHPARVQCQLVNEFYLYSEELACEEAYSYETQWQAGKHKTQNIQINCLILVMHRKYPPS